MAIEEGIHSYIPDTSGELEIWRAGSLHDIALALKELSPRYSRGRLFYIPKEGTSETYSKFVALTALVINSGFQVVVVRKHIEEIDPIPITSLLNSGIHVILEEPLDFEDGGITKISQTSIGYIATSYTPSEVLKPMKDRGRFIVICGPPNIGKSTQVRMFAIRMGFSEKLFDFKKISGIAVIKYPIYRSETGQLIDKILRQPDELDRGYSNIEIQNLYAQNRRDFQDAIIALLNAGFIVISEDYTVTGLSRGLTMGIPLQKLLAINFNLIFPDLSILLDGERLTEGIEDAHIFERAGYEDWRTNRQAHRSLAYLYCWEIIQIDRMKILSPVKFQNIHRSIGEIHHDIWTCVMKFMDKV